MRVLQIYYEPRFSGIGRHVADLSAYLTDHGVSVDVILPPSHVVHWQDRCSTCRLWPLAMHRWERGQVLWRIRRLAGRIEPDLLHIHGPYSGFWARGALLHGGPWRIVYTPHVLSLRRSLWRRLHWQWERRAARYTDAFVTVCDANRRLLVGRGGVAPGKIVVAHNGLSAAEWACSPQRDAMRAELADLLQIGTEGIWLGQVGRLDRQKGPDLTLSIWPRLAARRPDAHLFFWGDGPMQKTLLASWYRLPARERVHFLGWRKAAATEIAALDLLLAPSRWEGFPYTLLEALARETPVVATAVNGVPELLSAGDWLLPPEDNVALLAAVRKSLANRDAERAKVRRHKALARRRFTLSKQGALVQTCYERICGL